MALLVVGPLVALPSSFLVGDVGLSEIAALLLPEALRNSIVLAAGVGAGTLVVGGSLAALVSFWEFPGRSWLDWALVLPLAMPGYVLVFLLLGRYGDGGPLQRGLRPLLGEDFLLPNIRSAPGAIVVLTAVLYPYVYALGRATFLAQSRSAFEAARSLGLSHGAAVLRVALPLARPALAAGALLAIMEALADFGAVNLLNYRALTDAVYRAWYGAFDRSGALQLATVLVALSLTVLALERLLRGAARHHGALVTGEAVPPRRLHGWRALCAATVPATLLGLVFVVPVGQLIIWAGRSLGSGATATELARSASTTLALGVVAALVTVGVATVVAYGRHATPSRAGAVAAVLSSLGYAVPGTVVAVAVYTPLIWLDRRLADAARALFDIDLGLVITGSAIGLVIAYVVRFHALALFALDTRMGRIEPSLDEAARSLGADRARILREIHLPLLQPGMLTAALLVFVEVMKELPATALLRPLGGDTLAITVWEATKDSRFDPAALPALLIVAVGLVPVALLIRASRGR